MKTWIKLETIYKPSQGTHLLGKGSFVIFDPANLESIGNKDRVSSSVTQRSPIIVVGLVSDRTEPDMSFELFEPDKSPVQLNLDFWLEPMSRTF